MNFVSDEHLCIMNWDNHSASGGEVEPAGLVLCSLVCPWMVVFESVSFPYPQSHLSHRAQREGLTEEPFKLNGTGCRRNLEGGFAISIELVTRTFDMEQTRTNNKE